VSVLLWENHGIPYYKYKLDQINTGASMNSQVNTYVGRWSDSKILQDGVDNNNFVREVAASSPEEVMIALDYSSWWFKKYFNR